MVRHGGGTACMVGTTCNISQQGADSMISTTHQEAGVRHAGGGHTGVVGGDGGRRGHRSERLQHMPLVQVRTDVGEEGMSIWADGRHAQSPMDTNCDAIAPTTTTTIAKGARERHQPDVTGCTHRSHGVAHQRAARGGVTRLLERRAHLQLVLAAQLASGTHHCGACVSPTARVSQVRDRRLGCTNVRVRLVRGGVAFLCGGRATPGHFTISGYGAWV